MAKMQAYVFVMSKPLQAKQTAQRIAKLAGVKLVDRCWGRPDLIVFLEARDGKALEDVVLGKIAKVPGVQATETHLVVGS